MNITSRLRYAVRLTHVPSGITATVTDKYSRSEVKCRAAALRLLKARIYALEHPYIGGSCATMEDEK